MQTVRPMLHSLEEAIDDYFHMLVRTHPWDKKGFEEPLQDLNEWFETTIEAPAPIASATSEALARYLASMPAETRHTRLPALRDFFAWAAAWGWVENNPVA